ncbi:sodium:proton antiporter [Barrientosiimonas marina]
MQEAVLLSIVIIIVLGTFSQWLAWRIQWPSIVIMSVVGLLIGPVLQLINPEAALGELYNPLISLAVAVILFEGSSSLNFREIKDISKSVFRVVTLGALLAWVGGSLAAHYIAGLSMPVAFVIGGLFIVTGPTVIIPLLRQAKLKQRVATILKWEGTIIDPAGPLIALLAYQILKVVTNEQIQGSYLLNFFGGALLAIIIGLVIGLLTSHMANKGLFPEFLKSPIIMSFVLLCFSLGELIMQETGMLAVTVMGLTVAVTKKYIASIANVTHFAENISVILTSTVFVLLTASLTRETIMDMFTLPILGFVLVMLFLVRPLSIWIATIGTELKTNEKTLISWIAPRGIVALTVAGYFAGILQQDGFTDASILMTLTFALVFITVCVHGFTLAPLAKKLNLASTEEGGTATVLADYLQSSDIPVLLADSVLDRLIPAQNNKGIDVFNGDILYEHTRMEIDLAPYDNILIMTDDSAYNALIGQSFAPEFGYHNTFVLPADKMNRDISPAIKGHILFDEGMTLSALNEKLAADYSLKTITMEEKQTVKKQQFAEKENGLLLFIRKKNAGVTFITASTRNLQIEQGDQAVFLITEND